MVTRSPVIRPVSFVSSAKRDLAGMVDALYPSGRDHGSVD